MIYRTTTGFALKTVHGYVDLATGLFVPIQLMGPVDWYLEIGAYVGRRRAEPGELVQYSGPCVQTNQGLYSLESGRFMSRGNIWVMLADCKLIITGNK